MLDAAILEHIHASTEANDAGKAFVWTKSADDILASIVRFAQRTIDVHATR